MILQSQLLSKDCKIPFREMQFDAYYVPIQNGKTSLILFLIQNHSSLTLISFYGLLKVFDCKKKKNICNELLIGLDKAVTILMFA